MEDFVVRRTVFKCTQNSHHLKNIDAIIDVVDKNGKMQNIQVPAAYCPNCNVFFIMESVYQGIKLKGTLVCKVSDEKTYLSGDISAKGTHLSQESLLMQYGYSVSQEKGLTSENRRAILALLIDNKVMTRNEIISYIDFFIRYRKDQKKFNISISKWESDREFITTYKAGDFKQCGVRCLYRKDYIVKR